MGGKIQLLEKLKLGRVLAGGEIIGSKKQPIGAPNDEFKPMSRIDSVGA